MTQSREDRWTGSGYCTIDPHMTCDLNCERCIYNQRGKEDSK